MEKKNRNELIKQNKIKSGKEAFCIYLFCLDNRKRNDVYFCFRKYKKK